MQQVGSVRLHGWKLLHKDGASCADALQSFGFLEKKKKSWSSSPGRSLRHKPAPFAVVSSYSARKSAVPPTRRWPRNSTAIRGRSASGAHASLPSVSTAWLISRGPVHRGLFPPEDRHKVVVLATTKPAELGLPISHWSLEDLAVQILKDAHYRDMSRSTINRILNANDLKPHRCTQWLHSDDPDFERRPWTSLASISTHRACTNRVSWCCVPTKRPASKPW